jgi:predicted ATPase
MEVRRFHVEDYRSLKDVTVDFGQVTVIVGPNGAGKTNLYRALRLAHACGEGQIARAVVQEGGMASIAYAGRRKGEPRIELAITFDDLSYEISLGIVGCGGVFPRDPFIKREQILIAGAGKRRVELLDRAGATAFVRDDDGGRVASPVAFHSSESVLSQLMDPRSFPELVHVRESLRQMRFHHQLRADDEAPARMPSLATRTLAVADDGSDLAAALKTILREGDGRTLRRCVREALGGAEVLVEEDGSGRLELCLSAGGIMRPLSARELSDGQLRFLFLAAALLAPRPPVVVVLNEPEASLHGDLLPALAGLVLAAAERTQVVLTTHASSLAETLMESERVVGVELQLCDGATTVNRF